MAERLRYWYASTLALRDARLEGSVNRRLLTLGLFGAFLAVKMLAAQKSPQEPDLGAASAEEAQSIRNVCDVRRRINGPAAYYSCLRGKLAELSRAGGSPDLGGATDEEAQSIRNVCDVQRRINGPAAYYSCLRGKLAELSRAGGSPDLGGATDEEAQSIRNVCDVQRRINGPAAYYSCLRKKLAELNASAGSPGTRPKALKSRTRERSAASIKPQTLISPAPTTIAQIAPSPRRDASSPPVAATTEPNRDWEPTAGFFYSVAVVLAFGALALATVKTRQQRRRAEASVCPKCFARSSAPGDYCAACWEKVRQTNAAAAVRTAADDSASRERAHQDNEARRTRAEEENVAESARRAEAHRRTADERRRREERAKRARTIEELQALSGTEFEKLVSDLFRRDGYSVTIRGGSGDEGIDLLLHVGRALDVVQCKRWKSEIGSPVIREFYGSLIHAGARQGFVITTASFSASAKSFASGKPIILIDGHKLVSWAGGVRPKPEASRPNVGDGSDPYSILGVSPSASMEEICVAYRELIVRYHPDKVSHLGEEFQAIAAEKSRAIIHAYERLTGAGRHKGGSS